VAAARVSDMFGVSEDQLVEVSRKKGRQDDVGFVRGL
jgi:hypothetical protein